MLLAWVIIGIILLVIILLLCISLRICIRWQGGSDFGVVLWVWFIPIKIFPMKEKKEKKAKATPTDKESSKEEETDQKKEKKKSNPLEKWDVIKDLLRSVKKPLLHLKNHITIDHVKLYALVGAADAKETALSYAKHWILFTDSVGVLSEFVYIKQPDIAVKPDYLCEQSCYDLSLRIKIKPIFILSAALQIAFSFLKQYINMKNAHPTPPKSSGGTDKNNKSKQTV